MKIASVLLDDFGNNLLGNSFDKILLRNDIIIVCNDNKFGVFNSSDFSIILECMWDSVSQYPNGIIVSLQKQYGFYSYTGKCILNCVWDKIKYTGEGLIVSKNGSLGFYTFDGMCIFQCDYKRIETFPTAIIAFKNRKKVVYNRITGKIE